MTKIVPAQPKEKLMTAVAIDFDVFNLPGWPKNPNSSKPNLNRFLKKIRVNNIIILHLNKTLIMVQICSILVQKPNWFLFYFC